MGLAPKHLTALLHMIRRAVDQLATGKEAGFNARCWDRDRSGARWLPCFEAVPSRGRLPYQRIALNPTVTGLVSPEASLLGCRGKKVLGLAGIRSVSPSTHARTLPPPIIVPADTTHGRPTLDGERSGYLVSN